MSQFESVDNYFSAWVRGDKNAILAALDSNAYIEECYGPCYSGHDEIVTWLNHWFEKGHVLSWDITQEWYDATQEAYFCKWIFENEYKEKRSKFSGMSFITFNEQKQIKHLEEFQTTFTHKYPF